MADEKSGEAPVRKRARTGEFMLLLTGAMMWPFAPPHPIGTTLAACLIGIVWGYVRTGIRPRKVGLAIAAWGGGVASLGIAMAVALHAPGWISWAGWAGLFIGLTVGWAEREGQRNLAGATT